jgi:hypothetical protein
MTSKKTIVLNANKQKQLVDLNGSIHNFDISLQAKSKNKTDFYAIVVDQDTLNNNQNLDFKKTVLGEISASFIVDTNYNKSSYFLCLYADEQCEVDIIINIKEIPMKEIPIKEKPVLQNSSHFYDKKMSEPQKNHFHEKSKEEPPSADGRSIIDLLCLGASPGTKLEIRVEGLDESAEEKALRIYAGLSCTDKYPNFDRNL